MTPESRTQTKQSPYGWLKLFRLMRVIIRQNRATVIGDNDDDQDEILTEAKISANANQQQYYAFTATRSRSQIICMK